MTRARRSRVVRQLAAFVALAAPSLACCYLPGPSRGSSGGGSSATPPAPTPTLDRLGAHLVEGAVWAATPDALAVATELHDYPLHRADGIVVEVLPGAVSRMDVLVQLHDDGYRALPDLDDAERRGLLNQIAEDIRSVWRGADYYLCVAVRGDVFYGAMLEQVPGSAPVYVTEFAIDEPRVESCLVGPTHP